MLEVQSGQAERDHLNRLLPHVWRAYYDLRADPNSQGQAGDLLEAILRTYGDGLLVTVPTCTQCGYAMYNNPHSIYDDNRQYQCHYCNHLVGLTNFDPIEYGKR